MNAAQYGQHLIVRLSRVDNIAALNSEDVIQAFLTALVKRVGMRVMHGPFAKREDSGDDRQGCSGVVILYESHAAIHTYSQLREVFLDLFSCKEFNPDDVFAVTQEFFGGHDVTEYTLEDRGVHWGPDGQGELVTWFSHR